jgi:hypothetical protein
MKVTGITIDEVLTNDVFCQQAFEKSESFQFLDACKKGKYEVVKKHLRSN